MSKVDSSIVGLRIAAETTIGVLPGTPVWTPYEPNSYSDFGSEYMTTARNPISASRQRRKGSLTDEEASGGFELDWTQNNLFDLMPGFFFAAWRKKTELTVTSTTLTTTFNVASGGASFPTGSLLLASGFTNPANNGLKQVVSSTGTTVVVAGLVNETAPAGAKITRVGVQAGSGDVTVTVSSGIATLGSTTLNFTTLGLIPGEWIFIGGDLTAEKFATAANNGFARIKTIAANAIVLDRQPATMVTDAGAAKTIRLFFGHVIKNESDPLLIVRQTYQLERDFGVGPGCEYVKGAVPNELELKISAGDKVTASLSFMGLTTEQAAAKSGTRPSLASEAAFTASNDFSRIRLLQEDTLASLATYMDEISISITNNCSYNKAIGTLGAFEITAGDYEVMGEVTAYFTTFEAAAAIRTNKDVSLDFAMVAGNSGWLFDIPLVTLGNGRLDVSKDQPVKLPLSADATAHPTLNHTLLAVSYSYLPTAAS